MSNAVIGALRVNLGLDSASFTRGVQQAQNRMQQFGRRMQVVGAAISAVGTGVALAVRGQVNSIDELAKAALRAGLSVEALSQLQYAAELSDVSLSDLQGSMQRVSRAMVEDASVFEAAGIAVRDAAGEMRPVMDVFEDIADRLAAMPEGAERTALAIDLMGRSGANLIPLMAGGSAAIREMRDEADRLGLTISAETAASAQLFNDNVTRLTRTLTGFARQITAELLPVIEGMSEYLVAASSYFHNLSPTTRRFAAAIAGLTVVVGPLTVAAGLLVAALAGISAPVLLAVGAFTVITAAVVALWPHFVDLKDAAVDLVSNGLEALVRGFDDLRGAMQIAAGYVVDTVTAQFEQLVAYFAALPARFVEFGRNIIQGLADGILSAWDSVRDSVTGVFDGVLDYLPEWAQIRSPSRLFHGFGQFIMEGLANGLTARAQEPVAALQGVAEQMTGPIQSAASQISGAFENAFVGLVTGTMTAREALASLAKDLARMAAQAAFRQLFGGGAGGGIGGFFGSLFGGFRAMGGPVKAGTSYVVGERGPELFTPAAAGVITPNRALEPGGGGDLSVSIGFDNSAGGFTAMVRNEAGRVVASARQSIVQQAVSATYSANQEVRLS